MRLSCKGRCAAALLMHCFWLAICLLLVVICFGGTLAWSVGGSHSAYFEGWEHGWPVPFLERVVIDDHSNRWMIWHGIDGFDALGFAFDLLVYVVLTGAVVALWRSQMRALKAGRRYAFSLKCLLVFVAVAAVAFASVGNHQARSAREETIGEQLKAAGHSLDYAYRSPLWLARIMGAEGFLSGPFVETVYLSGDTDDHALLDLAPLLTQLSRLKALECDEAKITDEGFHAFLRQKHHWTLRRLELDDTLLTGRAFIEHQMLPEIRDISIDDSALDDDGFAAICSITTLREIGVAGTQLTNASLEHAVGMPRLTHLRLGGTRISAEAGKYLVRMEHLQALSLSDCSVDDDIWPWLTQCKSLGWCELRDTQISPEAYRRFRQERPDIWIGVSQEILLHGL